MNYRDSLKLRQDFAHYGRSYSLLHECANNQLIEYRRIFTPDRPALFLEHRLLRPSGKPYSDGWYLVDDKHWLYLAANASELLWELCDLKAA